MPDSREHRNSLRQRRALNKGALAPRPCMYLKHCKHLQPLWHSRKGCTASAEEHNRCFDPHVFECNLSCAVGATSKHSNPSTSAMSCKHILEYNKHYVVDASPDHCLRKNLSGTHMAFFAQIEKNL